MSPQPSRPLGFLSAPPAAPAVSPDRVAPMYKTWRFNVFLGIFIGYAGFYLIRNNVTLVSAILKEHDIMNAVGIGVVANAVLFSYGLSKFFMAMLSDRANARDLYFRPGSEQAARLMGIPNVLACEVEGSARSGAALVRLRSASFHVPAPDSTEPGSALVAIPAEAIELEPSADAAIIGRHAQVIGASFVRGSMHYDLETEFGTLVARAPAPAPAPFSGDAAPVFTLGDHVALEIRGGWVLPARR